MVIKLKSIKINPWSEKSKLFCQISNHFFRETMVSGDGFECLMTWTMTALKKNVVELDK